MTSVKCCVLCVCVCVVGRVLCNDIICEVLMKVFLEISMIFGVTYRRNDISSILWNEIENKTKQWINY